MTHDCVFRIPLQSRHASSCSSASCYHLLFHQFAVLLAQVVVLYVEQENSIRRQLMRAQLASQHNRRVADSGAGELQELRATDADVAKCQRRYEIFKVLLHLAVIEGISNFNLAYAGMADTRARFELQQTCSLQGYVIAKVVTQL